MATTILRLNFNEEQQFIERIKTIAQQQRAVLGLPPAQIRHVLPSNDGFLPSNAQQTSTSNTSDETSNALSADLPEVESPEPLITDPKFLVSLVPYAQAVKSAGINHALETLQPLSTNTTDIIKNTSLDTITLSVLVSFSVAKLAQYHEVKAELDGKKVGDQLVWFPTLMQYMFIDILASYGVQTIPYVRDHVFRFPVVDEKGNQQWQKWSDEQMEEINRMIGWDGKN